MEPTTTSTEPTVYSSRFDKLQKVFDLFLQGTFNTVTLEAFLSLFSEETVKEQGEYLSKHYEYFKSQFCANVKDEFQQIAKERQLVQHLFNLEDVMREQPSISPEKRCAPPPSPSDFRYINDTFKSLIDSKTKTREEKLLLLNKLKKEQSQLNTDINDLLLKRENSLSNISNLTSSVNDIIEQSQWERDK
eukprot:TRINITY_DN1851_c0_g1_i1.p1 TRINITY_DN1851_c0_g1~~TRINITY_DN1851_c0_g1_i1.p1  ORF type:complete len:190 (-),score=40.94 TRINITY_DN1851_c0_g1_i1:173-742(-)